MIRNLYKNKIGSYQTMYFVASENLNQFYKRIHTVKLYNSYLKKEREKLDNLRLELISSNTELEKLRESKDVVVNKTRIETLTIQKEVNEKNKLVKQLTKRQKEIEEEIRIKERTAKKLENELKKIIEDERKLSKAKGSKDILTAEDKIVSTDFEKNTGKLPWPTQRGIITGKYGEHQHPDYKNVMVRNDGIYISTAIGENARSIFKGVVSRVFQLLGENYTVIIKHGQYFSMYHNIVNVRVKPGQSVGTKEIIGTVYTDGSTKETILYFQIWKETEKRDPELWLAPL
jgi:septal ring factor EnvC (AmiA/AmiB activator)